eukprot:scaffold363_cov331-Pavlova_lutheri.AAC.39
MSRELPQFPSGSTPEGVPSPGSVPGVVFEGSKVDRNRRPGRLPVEREPRGGVGSVRTRRVVGRSCRRTSLRNLEGVAPVRVAILSYSGGASNWARMDPRRRKGSLVEGQWIRCWKRQ